MMTAWLSTFPLFNIRLTLALIQLYQIIALIAYYLEGNVRVMKNLGISGQMTGDVTTEEGMIT